MVVGGPLSRASASADYYAPDGSSQRLRSVTLRCAIRRSKLLVEEALKPATLLVCALLSLTSCVTSKPAPITQAEIVRRSRTRQQRSVEGVLRRRCDVFRRARTQHGQGRAGREYRTVGGRSLWKYQGAELPVPFGWRHRHSFV